jgi:hypothetical protein
VPDAVESAGGGILLSLVGKMAKGQEINMKMHRRFGLPGVKESQMAAYIICSYDVADPKGYDGSMVLAGQFIPPTGS